VNVGVVSEFSSGEKSRPFIGFSFTKDVEIGFYFLVHAFGFTIGLGVISSG
jgi:hypothetical protein